MMDPRRSWKERNKYYLSLKSSFLQLQTYVNDTSMSTVNCNKSGIPVARWFKFQWYWWIFHGHVHGNGWQIPNTTKHNKRNKDAQNQWSYHPGISTTSSALKKMPHCARDSIGIWTCGKGTAAVQENETWQCPFKTGCLWLTLDISR